MAQDLDSKLAFIIGHYKSGSTWLAHILSLHPGVRGARETHVFRYLDEGRTQESVSRVLFSKSAWGAGGVANFPRYWASEITRSARVKLGLATGTAALPASDIPSTMHDLGIMRQFFLRNQLNRTQNDEEYCRMFFTTLIDTLERTVELRIDIHIDIDITSHG